MPRSPVSFKDSSGHEWRPLVSVGMLGDLKKLGLDLAGAMKDPGAFTEAFTAGPMVVAESLWLAVAEQAAKDGITEEIFFRALDGDALGRGQEALFAAAAVLFPRSPIGSAIVADCRKVFATIDEKLAATINGALAKAFPETAAS